MEYHNDYLKHSIQPSHIQEHNKLNRRGPQFHPLNEQNLGVSVLLKFIVSMFDPSFSFSNPHGLRCLKNVLDHIISTIEQILPPESAIFTVLI